MSPPLHGQGRRNTTRSEDPVRVGPRALESPDSRVRTLGRSVRETAPGQGRSHTIERFPQRVQRSRASSAACASRSLRSWMTGGFAEGVTISQQAPTSRKGRLRVRTGFFSPVPVPRRCPEAPRPYERHGECKRLQPDHAGETGAEVRDDVSPTNGRRIGKAARTLSAAHASQRELEEEKSEKKPEPGNPESVLSVGGGEQQGACLLKRGRKQEMSRRTKAQGTARNKGPRNAEAGRPAVVRTTVGDLIAAAIESGGTSSVSQLLGTRSPLAKHLRQRLVFVSGDGTERAWV